jgi:hypothetical protein
MGLTLRKIPECSIEELKELVPLSKQYYDEECLKVRHKDYSHVKNLTPALEAAIYLKERNIPFGVWFQTNDQTIPHLVIDNKVFNLGTNHWRNVNRYKPWYKSKGLVDFLSKYTKYTLL